MMPTIFNTLRALFNSTERGRPRPHQVSNSTERGRPRPQQESTLTDLVEAANNWREQYSGIKGLTITRAVSLRDAWLTGNMAEIQWIYFCIELSDPDLFALSDRWDSAMTKLDWSIKQVPASAGKIGFDEQLAGDQAAALREAYDQIDNLKDALAHLLTARLRGFAHCELHHNDAGAVHHLEILDQWNAVRDGFRGAWKINPDAVGRSFDSLPAAHLIDPANWIIREMRRHLDWLGLVKFIRAGLADKDWDAWVEIYAIPGAVVIGPPNVPPEKEDDYKTAGTNIAKGASGYLPNGADVKFPTGTRATPPFRERLDYLSEKLILAGTGGKLTMLAAPTGIGSGPSKEQADVFDDLADAEGLRLSEVLQKQFDAPLLARLFPNKPVLAYFELRQQDQTDISEVIDHAVKLNSAGYRRDPAELSEQTGYTLAAPAPQPQSEIGNQKSEIPKPNPITNRAATPALDTTAVFRALAADLQPVRNRLARILQIADPDLQRAKLEALRAELPQLLRDIAADPEAARQLEQIMSASYFNGLAQDRESLESRLQPAG